MIDSVHGTALLIPTVSLSRGRPVGVHQLKSADGNITQDKVHEVHAVRSLSVGGDVMLACLLVELQKEPGDQLTHLSLGLMAGLTHDGYDTEFSVTDPI